MNFGGCSLPAVEDLEAELARLGDLGGDLGEIRRVHVIGRAVDEIAREAGRLREHLARARAVRRLAPPAPVGLDEPQRLHPLVGLLALVAIERVGAEQRALRRRVGAGLHGQPVAQHLDGGGFRAEVARAPQSRRRRAPDGLEGQLDALAETDDHHPARGNAAAGVHVRDVRGLAGEPLGFQDFGELPAERLVDAGGRLAQSPLFRVHADDDRVSLDRLQRAFRDIDFHAPPPGASAAARRIMSMSPSVVSMRSTSLIGTQRTSAASSPAMIVSSSDSGKAR